MTYCVWWCQAINGWGRLSDHLSRTADQHVRCAYFICRRASSNDTVRGTVVGSTYWCTVWPPKYDVIIDVISLHSSGIQIRYRVLYVYPRYQLQYVIRCTRVLVCRTVPRAGCVLYWELFLIFLYKQIVTVEGWGSIVPNGIFYYQATCTTYHVYCTLHSEYNVLVLVHTMSYTRVPRTIPYILTYYIHCTSSLY